MVWIVAASESDESDIELPRKTRTFLAQLRSGYSVRLNWYKHHFNPTVPDSCSDGNTTPHTVTHLFNCPMKPTDLTLVDFWLRPKEIAEFLNAWSEKDGWRATATTTTTTTALL